MNIEGREWEATVRRAQRNEISTGEVIDIGLDLEDRMRAAIGVAVPEQANLAVVNEWLADFRKRHWDS